MDRWMFQLTRVDDRGYKWIYELIKNNHGQAVCSLCPPETAILPWGTRNDIAHELMHYKYAHHLMQNHEAIAKKVKARYELVNREKNRVAR